MTLELLLCKEFLSFNVLQLLICAYPGHLLYFQSTPEVTSVQLILSFSLTVSFTNFVQSP